MLTHDSLALAALLVSTLPSLPASLPPTPSLLCSSPSPPPLPLASLQLGLRFVRNPNFCHLFVRPLVRWLGCEFSDVAALVPLPLLLPSYNVTEAPSNCSSPPPSPTPRFVTAHMHKQNKIIVLIIRTQVFFYLLQWLYFI